MWSLEEENPRLGISEEEGGRRKEGRGLLGCLAGIQKQIVPGLALSGRHQDQAKKGDETMTVTHLTPHPITEEACQAQAAVRPVGLFSSRHSGRVWARRHLLAQKRGRQKARFLRRF